MLLVKLKEKNADWIIANSLIEDKAGFGSDYNHVYVLGKNSNIEFIGSKSETLQNSLNFYYAPYIMQT